MRPRPSFRAALAALTLSGAAGAQTGYVVVRSVSVASLPGSIGPTGLDADGNASITHYFGASSQFQNGYLWDSSGLTQVGGATTLASDIGPNAELVGTTTTGSTSFGWRRPGATLIPLGTYGPWSSTTAEAINAAGAIAGLAGGVECFVWQNSVFTPLALSPGFSRLLPTDLNNFGDVGGELVTTQGRHTAGVWRQGACIDLTPNTSQGRVEALNDAGDATGIYVGPLGFSAFVWSAGALRDVSLPNATFGSGADINNSATAVGYALVAGQRRAWVDFGAATFDLNALALAPELTFTFAGAINDSGQIAALAFEGNDAYLVLLAPTCGAVSYCTPGTSADGCSSAASSTGAASATAASGFTLSFTAMSGQRSGLVFYGVSGRALTALPGSKGFLCMNAPLQRTSVGNTGGTAGACDGALTLDWNAYMAGAPGALGNPRAAGQLVQAQAWRRDPASVKPATLSDALEFAVCP